MIKAAVPWRHVAIHCDCLQGIIHKEESSLIKASKATEPMMQCPALSMAATTVERMVNQNTFADIAMDFNYWEDASDAFKPRSGTLLPLWKFTNERARRKAVTAVAWSPMVRYHDHVVSIVASRFPSVKKGLAHYVHN
jgi:hypothetical protein